MKPKYIYLPLLLSLALLAGCSQEVANNQTSDNQTSDKKAETENETASLPDGFFVESAPAEAVSIHQARASAEKGAEVLLTGYIGGRPDPFTKDRALFLLADTEKLEVCIEEHGCATPWDACCEAPEDIRANSVSIQVVDESGALLPLDLKGLGGLKEGIQVTVAGEVREVSDSIFIIDAKNIAVSDK